MSETRPLDAVVVGMGIAGLSCLWRLRAAGLDAVGLDAADRAGGVIRGLRAEGFLAETGPNTVPGTPEIIRLVEELALESELVRADPRLPRFVFRGGELHPVPMTLRGLAATKLLSARG